MTNVVSQRFAFMNLAAMICCAALWAMSWPYSGVSSLANDWWRGPLAFVPVVGHAKYAILAALILSVMLYLGIALRSWQGILLVIAALLAWYLPVFYLMTKDQA
jgi:hypothetical protein